MTTVRGAPCGGRRATRCRSRPTAAAVGLSATLACTLPRTGSAALSISSGYETFLTQIRNRIVCAEDDVYDEASQNAWAQPCDSMKDGPFCRGLPGDTARHRPFTLDSIVPQHIFGDPRATMELSASDVVKSAVDADTSANKQATGILNKFLEDFSKVKEVYMKPMGVEGRLDFSRLPMGGSLGLSRGFSLGLPGGVFATWTGPWQVMPAEEPPADSLMPRFSRRPRRPRARAVLRLNGAVGSLRFSRPVVVRSLQVRPQGGTRLWVRGRHGGGEVWRHAYEGKVQACRTGDLVLGRWEGDGQYYYARILTPHEGGATLLWIDRDPSHRLVAWEDLTTPSGKPCQDAAAPGTPASAWRDLARRSKAVDEVSFLVPADARGWLLGELHVATLPWQPEAEGRADEDSVRVPSDTLARVVQVLPGPHALIEDVSQAALYYNADDMLERGLRLFARRQELKEVSKEVSKSSRTSSVQALSAFRSVEGLKQMLRSLMPGADGKPSVRLPPHLSQAKVLADLDYLVSTLNVGLLQPEDQEKVVKRYGHFEIFFGDIWDWRTAVDSLQVLYELWRDDAKMQREGQGLFKEGQSWQGSYYCTQGRTKFSLDITEATKKVDGKEQIRADLTFTIVKKTKNVTGIYEVFGQLQPAGRSLVLEPVPDSWKAQPKNFVMVGTQGVVSSVDGTGRAVYAGTVPIYGCDSFELFSEEAPETTEKPESAEPWSGALSRLIEGLDRNRRQWRSVLQRLISEKPSKPNKVVQLLTGRNAGVLSVELSNGEEILLQLQSR